ncbi:hypothetical protein [Flavobacterium sp. FlaQc-47]|uniref:hypothetical protein n=1 Tax=Flavobacterium sp. FlaQc-47 TaxID=3374180 RepID=UPI0037578703
MNQVIKEKEELLTENEVIFKKQIIELRVQIEQLNLQKNQIWRDYDSLMQNISEMENFELIFKLVFEQNNLDLALENLKDDNLEKDEINLARKLLIKADILKLQNKKEALIYYKKAYDIRQNFETASFYIRYLEDIREYKMILEFIESVFKQELKIEERISLYSKAAMIYSNIDPKTAIKYYKIALDLIDIKLESDESYHFHKAGVLNYMAVAHKKNNDITQAFTACNNALIIIKSGKIRLQENIVSELASLYNTIALLYKLEKKYSESSKYFDLAIKMAKEKLKKDENFIGTIYINYCNLYAVDNSITDSTFITMIDQTLEIFLTLYNKEPLRYVEKLFFCYGLKAQHFLKLEKFDLCSEQIDMAETFTAQFVNLNKNGFQFLDAEISNLRIALYIASKKYPLALAEIDKLLFYYESSKLEDESSISTFTSLSAIKSNFIIDSDSRKAFLIKINNKIEPMLKIIPSLVDTYKKIQKQIEKL